MPWIGDPGTGYLDDSPTTANLVGVNYVFDLEAVSGTDWDATERRIWNLKGVIDVITPGGANASWIVTIETLPEERFLVPEMKRKLENAVNGARKRR